MKYSLIELFCGCGGFSHGFAKTGRFDVLLGADVDGSVLETFHQNHFYGESRAEVCAAELGKIPVADVLGRILRKFDPVTSPLHCMLAGPPCEGFSQNKRLEIVRENGETAYTRASPFVDDPRNFLFREMLEAAALLRPLFVAVENVPQMVTHGKGKVIGEIASAFRKLGYHLEFRILTACDYGVAQRRRRAFILATREDVVQAAGPVRFAAPTHRDPASASTEGVGLLVDQRPTAPTVRDAISDLPEAKPYETGGGPVTEYPNVPLSDYARAMRSEVATPYNHVARRPGASVLKRLTALKPGMRLDHLPASLRTKSYYYNCYGRVGWDHLAKTITKSCNYLGSGCFGHPVLDRGITKREAARLQSFEDDFRFYSGSEPTVAKMVGSAVPPDLAKAVAGEVIQVLDKVFRLQLGSRDASSQAHGKYPLGMAGPPR